MKYLTIVTIALFGCSTLTAQDKANFTLNLKNGDRITGLSDIKTIQFGTQYGNLAFPVNDIDKIQLGLQANKNDKQFVIDELDRIMFGAPEEANRSFDVLAGMDAGVIPIIDEYTSDINYRPKTGSSINVETLMEVLLGLHDVPKNYSEYDVIYFDDEHSIEGVYNFDEITVSTSFGDLTVKRKRIRSMEINIVQDEESQTRNFKLEAQTHIEANPEGGWYNTGIIIKEGNYIRMTATGEIVLASLSNNTYTADGGVAGAPGPENDELNFGNVIFKIGENGESMKAGDDFFGEIETTGLLYLSIYETVFNEGNTGSYNVKVRID